MHYLFYAIWVHVTCRVILIDNIQNKPKYQNIFIIKITAWKCRSNLELFVLSNEVTPLKAQRNQQLMKLRISQTYF
jgi:hypothetical protein